MIVRRSTFQYVPKTDHSLAEVVGALMSGVHDIQLNRRLAVVVEDEALGPLAKRPTRVFH